MTSKKTNCSQSKTGYGNESKLQNHRRLTRREVRHYVLGVARMLDDRNNPVPINRKDIEALDIPASEFFVGFASGNLIEALKDAVFDSGWSSGHGEILKMVMFFETNLAKTKHEQLVSAMKVSSGNVAYGLGNNPKLKHDEWNVLLLFSVE